MTQQDLSAKDDTSALSKHELRTAAMRDRICRAAMICLDRYGYAETTLARIQSEADVSRGALMHHFHGRHEIIAATALMLLQQSMKPLEDRLEDTTQDPLRKIMEEAWARVVDTPGGRAMLEILVACRTDIPLKEALKEPLRIWDRASLASISRIYTSSGRTDDDVEMLWSIWRTFMRGLLVHEHFVASPDYLKRMVMRMVDLIEPHMKLKNPEG